MLNFTVGPVMSSGDVLAVGARQAPYFRTPEFSSVMLENEKLMKEFAGAGAGARAVFLTGSGTAAMEAAVMGMFTEKDKVLVVNGGSFGQRFVRLCQIHGIPYGEIRLDPGRGLTQGQLDAYDGKGITGFLINMLETSTGVLYDMGMASRFCRENGSFLVVDAVSSFLADKLHMEGLGVGAMLTGSQKALACPPGISVLVLSEEAVRRARGNVPKSMYFDLNDALKDGERGQTPFTPAVSILLQINERLHEVLAQGGVERESQRVAGIALDFRRKIKGLPLEVASESLSNAVTPVHPVNACAYDVFLRLKDEYGIWVCPNGGELRDRIFRVGHLGCLTADDNDRLVGALRDMRSRGLL